MDDELRKAAQVALAAMEKEWGTKLSKGNAYSFMKAARALRAALANNANAAHDVSTSKTILVGRYILPPSERKRLKSLGVNFVVEQKP